MSRSIKARLILGIGDKHVVERPRELQRAADADEHNVTHALYSLQKDGDVTFKRKRNIHAPGLNVTDIKLTPKGQRKYEEYKRGS